MANLLVIEGIEVNKLNQNVLSFKEREEQLKEEAIEDKELARRERSSPFSNWYQVNKEYYKQKDWLIAKNPTAYRIFEFLVHQMDHYNAVVCSYRVLQETFNISQSTVTRAIKLLREKQFIDVYKSGTSNVYAINKNIVWNSWGSNYRYAKFGANVILSESEQKEMMRAEIKTIKRKEVLLKE